MFFSERAKVMTNSRREFLKHLGAAGVVSLSGLPPAFLSQAVAAGNSSDRVLVLVQLAGGNDGLNTVVPFRDNNYYKARPGIAIGKGSVLKLDSEIGLHPSMQGFKELFDEDQLAVIQGVGYKNPDRSHFRSMDIWQSAHPDSEDISSGWIGRALDARFGKTGAAKLPALSIGTEKLPLSLLSTRISVPTIRDPKRYELQIPGDSIQRKKYLKVVETAVEQKAPVGSNLEFLRATTKAAVSSAEALKNVSQNYKPASPYPFSSLANQLKLIAQMIASDFGPRVYFVSHGGFDTHSQQANAHNTLLNELSTSVTAFIRDIQGHGLGDQVNVLTFSEFGRRVKENGSLGTDHGAASQMFALGKNVKGGVIGKHPSLTDLDDGDLKFHTDFRQVYASVLDQWLDIDSKKVLNKKFNHVDFLR
jgi:uncharacterized protein (DUF1501 family)